MATGGDTTPPHQKEQPQHTAAGGRAGVAIAQRHVAAATAAMAPAPAAARSTTALTVAAATRWHRWSPPVIGSVDDGSRPQSRGHVGDSGGSDGSVDSGSGSNSGSVYSKDTYSMGAAAASSRAADLPIFRFIDISCQTIQGYRNENHTTDV